MNKNERDIVQNPNQVTTVTTKHEAGIYLTCKQDRYVCWYLSVFQSV